MNQSFRVEGLKELDKQLERLKPATGKAALRRALRKVAEPIADKMRLYAPDDPSTANEDLVSSIGVGTKLSTRQRSLHRRMFKSNKASVEMFVGAGKIQHAHLQEFGTSKHGAQPFARPAWDSERGTILQRLSMDIEAEIQRAIGRAAKAGKLIK